MDLTHGLAAALEQLASVVTPVFELAIVAVLWKRRLLKLFRWFAAFLVTDAIRSLSLWLLAGSAFAETYKLVWIYTDPPMLLLQIALVVELVSVLYKVYPGIYSFARIAIGIAVATSFLVTIFTNPLKLPNLSPSGSDATLIQLFQVERVLDLGLCLITFIIVGLFPSQHYAHRVRNHGFILSAFFGFESAGFFAINYGFNSEVVGLLLLGSHLALYPLWIRVFLAPDPERLPIPTPQQIARVNQLNEDFLLLAKWLTTKDK